MDTIKKLDEMNYDFGAGDSPFSFMSGDWCMSDTDSTKSFSSQVTVCNDGEFAVDSVKTFGEKTDITANYEANINGAMVLEIPSLCGAEAVAVESISISTSQGAKATASVKAHKHGSGIHKARERSIDFPTFNGWGASLFEMVCGISLDCVQSASYEIALGHKDQPNNVGEYLVGITHGETHTLKIDYVSDSAPIAVSGWIMTSAPDGGKKTRDGFVSGSVTYVKYVAAVAAVVPVE